MAQVFTLAMLTQKSITLIGGGEKDEKYLINIFFLVVENII